MPEPTVPLNEASAWASDIALVMFGGVRPNGRLTKTALCLLQGAPGAAQPRLTDVHQPASVTSSAAGPAPSKRELGLFACTSASCRLGSRGTRPNPSLRRPGREPVRVLG